MPHVWHPRIEDTIVQSERRPGLGGAVARRVRAAAFAFARGPEPRAMIAEAFPGLPATGIANTAVYACGRGRAGHCDGPRRARHASPARRVAADRPRRDPEGKSRRKRLSQVARLHAHTSFGSSRTITSAPVTTSAALGIARPPIAVKLSRLLPSKAGDGVILGDQALRDGDAHRAYADDAHVRKRRTPHPRVTGSTRQDGCRASWWIVSVPIRSGR